MSYGFDKSTRLYVDALQQQGYVTFSFGCEKLVDDFIRQLKFNKCWEFLNYLVLFANDGSVDCGRINLRQPYRTTPGSFSSVNWVTKKGIYFNAGGSFGSNFAPQTHFVFTPANSNTSFGAYTTDSSGAQTNIETYFSWAVGGGNFQTIRARISANRVDAICNTTVANPFSIVAGIPAANTLFYVEMGSIAGTPTRTSWTNKTQRNLENTGGAGSLPSTGNISMSSTDAMPSTRKIGMIHSGGAFYAQGKYDVSGGFADACKTLMDGIQAL